MNKMVKSSFFILSTAAFFTTAPEQTSAEEHTVGPGDTLYKIAKDHHTTVDHLKKVNRLQTDTIHVNQVLDISQAIETTDAATLKTAQNIPDDSAEIYTVKAGDSLSKIAMTHGVTVPDLVTWNKLPTKKIMVGQQLTVRYKKASSPSPVEEKPLNHTYTVKAGDSLSKIASQYKVTIQQLIDWNKLSSTIIYVDQQLIIHSGGSVQPPTDAGNADLYKVKSGDTLFQIALKYNVKMNELLKWNNLKSPRIFVNQTLHVKKPEGPTHVVKPPVEVPEKASDVIEIAMQQIGVPYVWAGNTPNGFDCSGFIHYVMNEAGHSMSRHNTQGFYDRSYEVSKPVPGDLVFFEDTYKPGISHMGIYIGNNQMIHAADNIGVIISSLDNVYWKKHFESFKRFY
ncbi:hypothetical protein KP77_27610 [Jeotgalibacillus alimentarius]|uniref:Uncharacterized protein n=2 Tax=Jeotgalibacillus alimentarius TaxID=135826 RepID=A0A0C2RXY0_9BACL|nr:hypothetical protein KP77_27610 [Jeotgalibacillus alimentarius]